MMQNAVFPTSCSPRAAEEGLPRQPWIIAQSQLSVPFGNGYFAASCTDRIIQMDRKPLLAKLA